MENDVAHVRKIDVGIRQILLSVSIVLLFLSIAVLFNHPYYVLAVIGGLFGLFLTVEPRVGIVVVIMSVFLFDWLSDVAGVLPRQMTWLPELVIAVLFLKVYVVTLKHGRLPRVPINKAVLVFVLFGLVSAVINDASPFVTFLGFRNYLKYVLLFYVVSCLDFHEVFLRRMILCVIGSAFLQIPVAVLQKYYLSVMPSDLISGDLIGGTLGAHTSGILTIFLLCTISLLIGFFYTYRKKRLVCVIGIMLLFIPMGLNETKITFFLTPLVVLFLMRKEIFKRCGKTVAVFILSALLLAATYKVYTHFYSEKVNIDDFLFSPDYLKEYLLTEYDYLDGSLKRVPAVIFAHEQITSHLSSTVLGVGPGNASDSFFSEGVGRYYRMHEGLKVDKVQVSRMLFEFGYVGFGIFLYLIYRVYRANRTWRSHAEDRFWKAISFGFEGIVFILVTTMVYANSFIVDSLAFTFWFVAGSLTAIRASSLPGRETR